MPRIYVGNLDFNAKQEQIRKLFAAHGAVTSVEITTDWETGHSRGFALVEMLNDADAEKAVHALNSVQLDGRSLVIRPAPPVIPMGFDALSIGRH